VNTAGTLSPPGTFAQRCRSNPMTSPIKRLYLSVLKPHPQNVAIFGDPRLAPNYGEIKQSIASSGLQERLVVDQDNQVVVGCLRLACLVDLYGGNPKFSIEVEVRQFGTEDELLSRMVESNIHRRVWTPQQQAAAYRAIKQALPEQGGTLQRRGRPKKASASGHFSRPALRTDAEAAKRLKIGRHKARALEEVFYRPGVAQELKDAVNAGKVSATGALRLIRGDRASSPSTAATARRNKVASPTPVKKMKVDAAGITREVVRAAKLLSTMPENGAVEAGRVLRQVMVVISESISDAVEQAGYPEIAPRLVRTTGGWLLPDLAPPAAARKRSSV
jgi:hypothetical protein